MTNTLFGRSLIACLLVLGLFFAAMDYVAQQLFLDNLLDSKREQLKLQNYVLLSSAQIDEQGIVIEEELREARFEDFESGLYGFISNEKGDMLWRSYSAHSIEIDPAILSVTQPEPGQAEFSVGEHYYRYYYTVLWEVLDDQPELITFTVLEDNRPALESLADFQSKLRLWLIIIGLALITILLWVLRWGTKPLRQLARKLKQVENGDTNRLEGQYPRELRRLTKNLNELLATEQRQRERYHATLADLAHSLKTPLAVIQAALDSGDQESHVIAEQILRMDEIITHQLQRAVVTAPHKLGEKVLIKATCERLTKALDKVYADKCISFNLQIDENIYFKGDQRDLTEVLGNLLDNACKHCISVVKVHSKIDGQQLRIEVHDDGNGVKDEYKKQLLHRGLRADTRHAGQGIGLDIARDIINSYQGELEIADSPLGGALFRLNLPV